jgi:hypothetical protein
VTAHSRGVSMRFLALPVALVLGVAAGAAGQNAAVTSASAPTARSSTTQPSDADRMYVTLGHRKIYFGVDLTFAGIKDDAQAAAMGRERQVKFAYANLSMQGDLTDHISFAVVANPVKDQMVPKPYQASPTDRRTYFFPNSFDGRGVVSDPEGLYKVDYYKHPGLDPLIQQGDLRIGYVDVHAASKRYGVALGRNLVPQGLSLNELVWFTSRDLTHIQAINAQADAGGFFYYDSPQLRVDLAVITGNGSPYMDYGYFDFTDASEDKNSAVGAVLTGRVKLGIGTVGASYRKNYLNSRIEDSISVQLSKHNDDALIVFAMLNPMKQLRVYGEWARYKWGLAASSAALLPGPPVTTPVNKDGYYVGADLWSPKTKYGTFGITVLREELSRDDSLVSWAAANHLFGVVMGTKETSTIVKVQAKLGSYLTFFFYTSRLENPFPELSAIKPISGPGSDQAVSFNKIAGGVRLLLR